MFRLLSDAKDAFIIFDEAYEGNDVDAFYLGKKAEKNSIIHSLISSFLDRRSYFRRQTKLSSLVVVALFHVYHSLCLSIVSIIEAHVAP